ncbi:MAG: hypothetical protein IKE42_29210 [Aquamicrobium sp.]|uniref:hypothetical protein n=1 Tax=Mesorhizobium TaxID=68287 RepID=UPI0010104E69|nr:MULTISPECIES: hypothetical protein [Mesorhizobium]MBR2691956.1 hypothetical protein [Aquamicrobium sp.]
MKKIIYASIVLAATCGVSYAANLNPDRDPTRGFAPEKTRSVSAEHTASVPSIETPKTIRGNRPYDTEDGRAPWAGRN